MRERRKPIGPLPGLLTAGALVLAAAAVTVTPARAGGLSEPVVEPVVVAAPDTGADVVDWRGFFVGGQLGYAFGGSDDVGIVPPGTNAGALENQGAFGGVVLGYRWQPRSLVFGIVGEISAADITDSLPAGPVAATTTNTWMASLRLMAGLPFGRTMPYVTLGMATGNIDYRVSGGGIDLDTSFTASGTTGGFGIERDLGGDWSLIGEYRYTEFGSVDLFDALGTRTRATPKYDSVSIAITRRF